MFDQLDEAATHTDAVARLLGVLGAMSITITTPPTETPVRGMSPVSCYVPTFVGEHFKYTDIPGSGTMYYAKVLCIKGDDINIIHTGRDIKYGSYIVNIRQVEFMRLRCSHAPTKQQCRDSDCCGATAAVFSLKRKRV